MNDDPVLAAAGAAPMPAPVPARRPSRWLRRLVVLMLIGAALIAGVVLLASQLHGSMPVNVTIDGDEVVRGFDVGTMEPLHKLALVSAVVFGLLVAAIVLPVALVMLALGVLSALLLMIGLPLLLVLGLLMLLMSPLLLVVWLLWKVIAS